jgi:hypothetical protein
MAAKFRGMLLGAGVGAALVSCAQAGVATAASSPAAPARAELTGPGCRRAVDPAARAVTITAVMRPVTGTSRMSLKFGLERRIGRRGHFALMHSRNLGTWVYPTNPATLGQNAADIWIRKQNVVNLARQAYYRFRVEFRWTGTDGRVLADVVRRGPLCYQPELRPNLAVGSIAIDSLGNQEDRYTTVVRNGGATASGPFALVLQPGTAAARSETVDSVAPGDFVREAFVGPTCAPGSSVTVTADPEGQVGDYDRADNTLTVACPDATAGA